jgi:hypothetical protein
MKDEISSYAYKLKHKEDLKQEILINISFVLPTNQMCP